MVGIELEEIGARNLEVLLTFVEGNLAIHTVLGAKTQEDGVQNLVIFGLGVTGSQETVLLNVDGAVGLILGDGQDGVTDFLGPCVHDFLNWLAADGTEAIPQVSGLGVAIGVLLEVLADTLEEDVFAEVCGDHAKNARALGVGNGVENLVDFVGSLDGHFDGVGAAKGVERQG